MLKACVKCGTPSEQARCPEHRYTRPRGRRYRQLRQRIIERDGYQCRRCGCYVEGKRDTHVDHIRPLADEGQTIASNLQTLCRQCNEAKGAT